jgi:hypothetical protein
MFVFYLTTSPVTQTIQGSVRKYIYTAFNLVIKEPKLMEMR